jgi:hypothetical protein
LLLDSPTVRAKKTVTTRLWGSRGIKHQIHAATHRRNGAVALHLTAGHAHERRRFESLYESFACDNVLAETRASEG